MVPASASVIGVGKQYLLGVRVHADVSFDVVDIPSQEVSHRLHLWLRLRIKSAVGFRAGEAWGSFLCSEMGNETLLEVVRSVLKSIVQQVQRNGQGLALKRMHFWCPANVICVSFEVKYLQQLAKAILVGSPLLPGSSHLGFWKQNQEGLSYLLPNFWLNDEK